MRRHPLSPRPGAPMIVPVRCHRHHCLALREGTSPRGQGPADPIDNLARTVRVETGSTRTDPAGTIDDPSSLRDALSGSTNSEPALARHGITRRGCRWGARARALVRQYDTERSVATAPVTASWRRTRPPLNVVSPVAHTAFTLAGCATTSRSPHPTVRVH